MMRLLTKVQTAEMLGVSERTIGYWTATKRLPGFVKVLGNARWREDILRQWIEDGCPEHADSGNGGQRQASENSAVDAKRDGDTFAPEV